MVVIEKIIINRKESDDLTVKTVVKKMQQIAVAVIDDSVGLCELPDLRFTVIEGDDLLLARFLAITDYQPSAPFQNELGFRYAGLLKVKASDDLIFAVEHGITAHLLCALEQPAHRDRRSDEVFEHVIVGKQQQTVENVRQNEPADFVAADGRSGLKERR